MPTQQLTNIRKKAAADSITELRRALEQVKEKYQKKYKLRTVLNRPEHKQSIRAVADHLTSIKLSARRLLNIPNEGALHATIGSPIEWAEEELKEMEKLIDEARELARDIRAFEIDESALCTHRDALVDDASEQLAHTTDPLSGLNKIWEEAFELAAGICLRHEGLDDGLCQIADALIEEINWIKGKAFAVPSRSGGGTLSKVVHLRFPEWSIWALPLTAHEVWHLRLRDNEMNRNSRRDRLLESVLENARIAGDPHLSQLNNSAELLWADKHFQCQMGDVFGVYSLGPAYACACIDLALDQNEELARQRAATICHVLKLVLGYEKSIKDKEHIVEILEAQWKEGAGSVAALNHQSWIDAVFAFLQRKNSGFALERWKADHGTLLSAFKTGKCDDLKTVKVDIRGLLNAAWRMRIDFPDQTDETAKTCKRFCDLVLYPTEEHPRNIGSAF